MTTGCIGSRSRWGVLWGLWAGQASQRRSRPGRIYPCTLSHTSTVPFRGKLAAL